VRDIFRPFGPLVARYAMALGALQRHKITNFESKTASQIAPLDTMTKKDLENVDAEGFGSAMLDSFTIDISHQEMERIIVELELLHKTQPAKWLPIQVGPVKSLNLFPTAAAAPPTRATVH